VAEKLKVVPLSENCPCAEAARGKAHRDPCVVIILGASGDLTRRKLLPAIAALGRDGHLPERFCLMATGRKSMSTPEFVRSMMDGIDKHIEGGPPSAEVLERLSKVMEYVPANPADRGEIEHLGRRLEALESKYETEGNRLFYLSLPPSVVSDTVKTLSAAGLLTKGGTERSWQRVVVEKPFGTSLATAHMLNEDLREMLIEDQIFRIDHYLGKDTVQNLLMLRFANVLFEPVWNRNYVDHVQITVSEEIGIEGRGAYFEEAGILRDMFQNHLLQTLCLFTMEPPVNFTADAVRDEKTKVLRAIRQWRTPEEVARNTVRGQYGPGTMGGVVVPSYRQETGVAPGSTRETFAAVRFFIDNWRWQSVPFYLRSGKRLDRRISTIFLQFKTVPHMMFKATDSDRITPNSMLIRIQPNEGINISFQAKAPGVDVSLRTVSFDFSYNNGSTKRPPSAYQTLLLQTMDGDATLFTRRDETEAQWQIIDPILRAWQEGKAPSFPNYDPGTWGPSKSEELIERDGRDWFNG